MRRQLAAVVAVAGLVAAVHAPAAGHQPYGGCKEAWQAPRSGGAQHCRQHGWLVRPRVVVTPDARVVANRLPACRSEDDQRGCYWDAQVRGNGRGVDFIRIPVKRGFRTVLVHNT